MNSHSQISRGLERLMANAEANRVAGLYGLAGMESVDSFEQLGAIMGDVGMAGVGSYLDSMRARHRVATVRMCRALPLAVDAYRMTEAVNGNLAGLFSKVKKAVKKVTKAAVKLSPSHALIKKVAPKAAILSPSMMLVNKVSAPKSDPAVEAARAQAEAEAAVLKMNAATTKAAHDKAAKSMEAKAARAVKLQAKADAAAKKKADREAAKVAKAAQTADAIKAAIPGHTTSMLPTETGAAVLANQSGVNLTTPAAQQFAQEVVSNAAQPGSTLPSMSMFNPEAASSGGQDAGPGGFLANLTPVQMGVGALALAGVGWLVLKKRRG